MMSESGVLVEAPSNIALIKYMGKLSEGGNRPTNSSFSLVLPELVTRVQLTPSDRSEDSWSPLLLPDLKPIEMNEFSIQRYLRFLSFLKDRLGVDTPLEVKSANNFASDCGIASSASSFAALTEAVVQFSGKPLSQAEKAELSRQGSGSSGRSFFDSYCVWNAQGFFEASGPELLHLVIVAEGTKKKVSSSEAHRRVGSSLLFDGRPQRAEARLKELRGSFEAQDWQKSFELCWAEFWDMHALFETANPSFGYLHSSSLRVLAEVRALWADLKDGPVATMDAGPNVHLLFRRDQEKLFDQIKKEWSSLGLIVSGRSL